jgi:hypothetical protein
MNKSEQDWEQAIKNDNAKVFNYDSLYKLIESNPDRLKIYFATKTKRGTEHFASFITTIRGEKYKVYKFLSRTRINRIINRTKLRQKM